MSRNAVMKVKRDNSFCGWNEYDVKEMGWQIFTWSGETYVKKDFQGNFIHTHSGKELPIYKIFTMIRNVVDAQGFIIAKRKRMGSPLSPVRDRKKFRMPHV